MKKSLIALAVLAASGVASAQSTVTLYGLVDAWAGSSKGLGVGAVSQNGVNPSTQGGLQTSRFGFKGTEDLGGGLAANFLLEQGFLADTGVGSTANQAFGRQSWVGLSGGFGAVKLGRMWTPYDDISGATNPGFDSIAFSPVKNVWASENYNDKPGNSIYYSTPDFGGFTAAAAYAFGENKTAAVNAGKIASFNVAYAGGPIYVGLAYQTEKNFGGVAVANAVTTKYTRLNGSYDFGVAKLLLGYGRVKDGTFNPAGVAGAGAVPKSTDYTIGADFPITGAFTLSGGYARSKDSGFAGGGSVKRTGLGITGLYALSKRTNLYIGAQTTKSKPTAFAGAIDTKGHNYGLGIRHTF